MKLDKRRLLGPLFGPLSRAKHSRASRYLLATVWLPSQIVRAWRNRPVFAVDISSPKGLGALLSDALLMCRYAEQNGLQPFVVSSNPLYAAAGQDALSPYFAGACEPPSTTVRPMRYRTLQSFYHLRFEHHLALPEATRLFKRHFRPRPVIMARVDAILQALPDRHFDLSLHYRATDKVLEAALVPREAFASAVQDHAHGGGRLDQVFLATDDASFDAFIRQRFPGTVFHSYNLGQPSDASRGRHFSDLAPQDKAIEALVNMFLLAAAPACIRSASYLSAMSKIINPELRTRTLNRDHWGSRSYPESEILAAEALYAPAPAAGLRH